MNKKIFLIIMIISLSFVLNGCWSVRGLDEFSIVSGIAIDKEDEHYILNIEIIDIANSSKQTGVKTYLLESEGNTIFDAVRNAKKRIESKLYFSNAQIIILSENLATEEDLPSTMDWLLRDVEPRETMYLLVSQEKTAKEIIESKSIGESVLSSEIKSMVERDNEITSSTSPVKLYEAENTLYSDGISLVLPAIHVYPYEMDKTCVEINGSAIFKNQNLIGFLTPEESKYYLFITDNIKGGLLTFSNQGETKHDITLEIVRSKTDLKYTYDHNKLKFTIKVKTDVLLGETLQEINALDNKVTEKIKKNAEKLLINEITNLVKKMQNDYNSDIFGFGHHIYKTNHKLWLQLKTDWDELFPQIEVEVIPDINITNSATNK